jgi:uncharacterized protein YjlB
MKQYLSGILLPEHTQIYLLDDDGVFPNNPTLPVVLYQHAFQISNPDEAAGTIERVFAENGWHHFWRNGVFDYHHFHSTAHEVLVACSGSAQLMLGGPSGEEVRFQQGDALILPAGTAHKCIEATDDFVCVGAYPLDQLFDMCYGKVEERSKEMKNIQNVPLPKADPVYGKDGPLTFHWDLSGK